MIRFATVVMAVAGLLLVAACGDTATVATSSPKGAIGSPAATKAPAANSTYNLAIGTTIDMNRSSTGDTWKVTVNSVKKFVSTNQFETPDAGMQFIVIDVTYEVTKGTVDANPFDWKVKDSTGLLGKDAFADYTLHASTIEAPNKTRGTVVLQIAPGSSGTVVYSPGFSEKASWAFSAADIA